MFLFSTATSKKKMKLTVVLKNDESVGHGGDLAQPGLEGSNNRLRSSSACRDVPLFRGQGEGRKKIRGGSISFLQIIFFFFFLSQLGEVSFTSQHRQKHSSSPKMIHTSLVSKPSVQMDVLYPNWVAMARTRLSTSP